MGGGAVDGDRRSSQRNLSHITDFPTDVKLDEVEAWADEKAASGGEPTGQAVIVPYEFVVQRHTGYDLCLFPQARVLYEVGEVYWGLKFNRSFWTNPVSVKHTVNTNPDKPGPQCGCLNTTVRQRIVQIALVLSLILNLLAAIQLSRHGWEANQAKKHAAEAMVYVPDIIDIIRGNPDTPNVNLSLIQNDMQRASGLLNLAVTMDPRLRLRFSP